MMMKNLRISTALTILTVVSILAMILISIFGVYNINVARKLESSMYYEGFIPSSYLLDVKTDYALMDNAYLKTLHEGYSIANEQELGTKSDLALQKLEIAENTTRDAAKQKADQFHP